MVFLLVLRVWSPTNTAIIFAIGSMVYPAVEVAVRLKKNGINVVAVNCRFVKPIDEGLVANLARKIKRVVIAEENVFHGGFGSAVLELFEKNSITDCKIKRIGVPDEFVEHGSQKELRSRLHLDADGIEEAVREILHF